MSGDYSRKRFNPENHYHGVLRQQGRLDLDADWNEYVDLADRRWRAETVDVVGRCGVPYETPDGFRIQLVDGQWSIGPGRMYVHGYLAENLGAAPAFNAVLEEMSGAAFLPLANQPYSATPFVVTAGVRSLVYLDVWRREVTHLEAPELIEPAVNVDTTTRYQTAWQVRLLSDVATGVNCQTALTAISNWPAGNLPSTARLTSDVVAVTSQPDPCLVPPSGGYRGLENHLYRVEVHGMSGASVLVKWSRENASVASYVMEILPGRTGLRVESLGRDEVLRFKTNDWVEVTSDSLEFRGLPGEMRQVTVDDANQTLTFSTALPVADFPAGATAADTHVRVIRWDQSGIVRRPDGSQLVNLDTTPNGLIPLSAANPSFILEHGVQVTLTVTAGGTANTRDYWVFVARTADADIERLTEAPPAGVHHHFCKLAIIEANGTVTDCRSLFPALTDLVSLFYVSGDGQETLPGQALPRPIQVGVANGDRPLTGARVNFRVTGGGGNLVSGTVSGADITIATDSLGVASVNWTLDTNNTSQQVEARLADGSHLPVRFNAGFAQAGGVEPGVHVLRVNVGVNQLLNDTNVPVTQLANGISVDCDSNLFQNSVRAKPVCILTLAMPFPFNSADMQLWGSTILGFTPLELDAEVNSDDASIFWQPTRETRAWLIGRLFPMMAELRRGERVLARLTLKGNFIWAQSNPNLYLDGEVFGVQTAAAGNTFLRFPSGDGRRGGDLEMWFWLVPPPPPPTLPTATLTATVVNPTLTATVVNPTLTATVVNPTLTAVTRTTIVNPTIVRPPGDATRIVPTRPQGAGSGSDEAVPPTVIVPPRPGGGGTPFAAVRALRSGEARKLQAAGMHSVQDLANAPLKAVRAALALRSDKRAREIIEEAKRLIG